MTKITVFTDGASRGNPGLGGWGAVIVQDSKVAEVGGRENHTTNNQMELRAAIEGLKKTGKEKNIIIYTDSSYVINGITKWVNGWEKNNWMTKTKTEVLNKELWKKLMKASDGKKIEWKYLGGHRGIAGNERCDEIAVGFAGGPEQSRRTKLSLYKGSLEKYEIDILNIDLDHSKSDKRTKDRTRSKAKAYSYVSSVDGKVMVHSTWADCEKRVKGKSGARYKKALDKKEEVQIISEFKLK